MHAYMDVGSRAMQEQLPRRSCSSIVSAIYTASPASSLLQGLECLAVTQREAHTYFIFLVHLTTLSI